MKKLIIMSMFLIFTTGIFAQTFIANGIAYKITSEKTVEVTNFSPEENDSITIPSTVIYSTITYDVTAIGEWAFDGYDKLKYISIPNSITLIKMYAFKNCSNLTSITIPTSVTSIGLYAFKGCMNLTLVNIPNSVISIGNSAFEDCRYLTSIDIPNSVTSIGNGAFQNCLRLTSITIPSSVTSIGPFAFATCGLTTVNYNATNCANMDYDYPVFAATLINNLTIGSNVTTIPENAFLNCGYLTSISIPSSVTTIGKAAFYNCLKLTSIYAMSKTPVDLSSALDAFGKVSKSTCILYVPIGSKSLYEVSNGWKDFTNIIEMPTAIKDVNLSNLNIYTQGTSIIVEHAENYPITLYSVSGQKIYEVVNPSIKESLITSQAGVYMVTVGRKTKKVAIK